MKNDDLEVPAFLKRSETEAQAEARRAKNKPKDESKGLKVVDLPDTKITAAIAKDFVEKGSKAQKAVDDILAANKSPAAQLKAVAKEKKNELARSGAKATVRVVKKGGRSTHVVGGSVIAKALRERDALNAKAAEAKSAKPTASAKKPAAKSARASSGKYDWDKATTVAKSGKLPPLPPFNSYKSHIKKFYDLAVKKDVSGIKKLSGEYTDEKGARTNMFRYRDLLLVALK